MAAIAIISVFVLVDALRGNDGGSATPDPANDHTAISTDNEASSQGPVPSATEQGPVPEERYGDTNEGQLPPGGPVTQEGTGNYRTIGKPGAHAGTTGKEFTYVIEAEDTINTADFGGDDAFSAMVDSTLTNPKGWTSEGKFKFRHIKETATEKPDLRLQLSSQKTTEDVCGNSFKLETSCFYGEGNRVVLNESRWVRGALPFDGDLGSYRQYLINHEVGHGLGFAAHQPCQKDGALAPIMMQQTLSLNNGELKRMNPNESYDNPEFTCRPNPWPYPIKER